MPVPPAPEAPSPVAASRLAWQRYLGLDVQVPAEALVAAVTDVPSRDALLLMPHLSTWEEVRTLHRTDRDLWTLDPATVCEAVTRRPDEKLLARITDGAHQVLRRCQGRSYVRVGTPASIAILTRGADAFATLAHLSWTARDYAAARKHTDSALNLRPEHSLAVALADTLDADLEPEWALAPRLRGPAASFAVPQ